MFNLQLCEACFWRNLIFLYLLFRLTQTRYHNENAAFLTRELKFFSEISPTFQLKMPYKLLFFGLF